MVMRAHTGAAPLILCISAFLLGGGDTNTLYFIMLVPFSILLHWFHSGHNSLMDSAMGYDIKDPNKKHFPQFNGTLTIVDMHRIIHLLLFFMAIWLLLIVYISPGGKELSLMFFLIYIVTGHVYNDGLSKATIWGWVFCSISMASLYAGFFFLAATGFNYVVVHAIAFTFLLVAYQIGVSGEVKDLDTKSDEKNFLKYLGGEVKEIKYNTYSIYLYQPGVKVFVFALMIKVGMVFVVLNLFKYVDSGFNFIYHVPVLALMFANLFASAILVGNLTWDHDRVLRFCAYEAITNIFLGLIMISPFIGYIEAYTLIIASLLYYVVLNRIIWNTTVTPRV